MKKFKYITTSLFIVFFTFKISAQSTFSISAESGFSYNKDWGLNIGVGGDYDINENSSISAFLRLSNVYTPKSGPFYDNGGPLNADFTSNPDFFEVEEGSDLGGLVHESTFWKEYDYYLKHYDPEKDFRHDFTLSLLYNYNIIQSDKWKASIGAGVGIGLAEEQEMIASFTQEALDGSVILHQIDRRTKYLYYQLPMRIEVDYEIRKKLEIYGYGSITYIPKGDNFFNADIFNKFMGVGLRFSIEKNK